MRKLTLLCALTLVITFGCDSEEGYYDDTDTEDGITNYLEESTDGGLDTDDGGPGTDVHTDTSTSGESTDNSSDPVDTDVHTDDGTGVGDTETAATDTGTGTGDGTDSDWHDTGSEIDTGVPEDTESDTGTGTETGGDTDSGGVDTGTGTGLDTDTGTGLDTDPDTGTEGETDTDQWDTGTGDTGGDTDVGDTDSPDTESETESDTGEVIDIGDCTEDRIGETICIDDSTLKECRLVHGTTPWWSTTDCVSIGYDTCGQFPNGRIGCMRDEYHPEVPRDFSEYTEGDLELCTESQESQYRCVDGVLHQCLRVLSPCITWDPGCYSRKWTWVFSYDCGELGWEEDVCFAQPDPARAYCYWDGQHYHPEAMPFL